MTDFDHPPADDTGTAADPVVTTITEYSQTAAALSILESRYADVTFDLATKDGMAAAKAARNELRGYRTGLEKARTAAKAEALDYTRRVDAEAKMIRERLEALEDPIAEQIRAEEERLEAERARIEREREEREAAQSAKIDGFRQSPLALIGAKADAVAARIDALEAEKLEDFDESVLAAALTARDEAIRQLRTMHAAALQTEEAAAVIAKQRAELAEQQRLADERARADEQRRAEEQAERDRVEQERRDAERAEQQRLQAIRDAELEELRQRERQRQEAEALAEMQANERRRVINMLRGYPDRHARSGIETLRAALDELKAYVLDPVLFAADGDRLAAEDARAVAHGRLSAMLSDANSAAEAAELAKQEAERQRVQATEEAKERERAQVAADEHWINTAPLDEAVARALALLAELGAGSHRDTRALAAAAGRTWIGG